MTLHQKASGSLQKQAEFHIFFSEGLSLPCNASGTHSIRLLPNPKILTIFLVTGRIVDSFTPFVKEALWNAWNKS